MKISFISRRFMKWIWISPTFGITSCDILFSSTADMSGLKIVEVSWMFRLWTKNLLLICSWTPWMVSIRDSKMNCEWSAILIIFFSLSINIIWLFCCLISSMKLYGYNSVEVEVKNYWTLFVNEVFNPFYLFQIFSIILWSLDEYYQYATCVFLLSATSCMMALYQTKQVNTKHYSKITQFFKYIVVTIHSFF